MPKNEKTKCRCNKCSCGSEVQALFCSIMGNWLCPLCAEKDEHAAFHILLKEDNPGIVYPTDFQETVIRLAGDKPCVNAERHAVDFEAFLLAIKDKRIAAILAQGKVASD